MSLIARKCIPCTGGFPPLTADKIAVYAPEVPDWEVLEDKKLRRVYKFPDYLSGLDFVNRVAQLAEQEGHHPDIVFAWGRVEVEVWTHKVDGLTESDFILAAKIEHLERPA